MSETPQDSARGNFPDCELIEIDENGKVHLCRECRGCLRAEVARLRVMNEQLQTDVDCGCQHGFTPDGDEISVTCEYHSGRLQADLARLRERCERMEAVVEAAKEVSRNHLAWYGPCYYDPVCDLCKAVEALAALEGKA